MLDKMTQRNTFKKLQPMHVHHKLFFLQKKIIITIFYFRFLIPLSRNDARSINQGTTQFSLFLPLFSSSLQFYFFTFLLLENCKEFTGYWKHVSFLPTCIPIYVHLLQFLSCNSDSNEDFLIPYFPYKLDYKSIILRADDQALKYIVVKELFRRMLFQYQAQDIKIDE